MVPTVFVDYRPLHARGPGLSTLAASLLSLPFDDSTVRSLSCLHVIEHIGLGRYGDVLDPLGSRKAAAELCRVLADGGRLLVSVPVGRERIQFNAHRIFAPQTVMGMFTRLALTSFSLVDDNGVYHPSAHRSVAAACQYACGMFEFVKPTD